MFKKMSTDLVRTVKSGQLGGLAKEVTEAGIDAVLEQDGLIKDLPVVGSLVALAKVGASVRDRLLAEKIVRFLAELNSLAPEEREEMIAKLEETEGFRDRVGERLLEILERISIDRQPEMIAKVFAAFARGEITTLDLKRLAVAIERVPPHELENAREYYSLDEDARWQADIAMTLALQGAGLLAITGGYDGGAYYATPLMDLFMKLELDR